MPRDFCESLRPRFGLTRPHPWVPRTTPLRARSRRSHHWRGSLKSLVSCCQRDIVSPNLATSANNRRNDISLCNRQPGCRRLRGQNLDWDFRREQIFQLALKASFDQMVKRAAAAGADQDLFNAVDRGVSAISSGAVRPVSYIGMIGTPMSWPWAEEIAEQESGRRDRCRA